LDKCSLSKELGKFTVAEDHLGRPFVKLSNILITAMVSISFSKDQPSSAQELPYYSKAQVIQSYSKAGLKLPLIEMASEERGTIRGNKILLVTHPAKAWDSNEVAKEKINDLVVKFTRLSVPSVIFFSIDLVTLAPLSYYTDLNQGHLVYSTGGGHQINFPEGHTMYSIGGYFFSLPM